MSYKNFTCLLKQHDVYREFYMSKEAVMNIFKSVLCVLLGFILGYITQGQKSTLIPIQPESNTPNETAILKNIEDISPSTKQLVHIENITPQEITNPTTLNQSSSITQETLKKDYQKLKREYQALIRKVDTLNRQVDELDDSDITNEQMAALTMSPFDDIITQYTGKMRDNIFAFHQAEQDLDWGYTMQQHISDFILTHYNAPSISLISIQCKWQQCELLIIEHEQGSWFAIAKEMQQQNWWNFHSSSSSSSNARGYESSLAIYTFLSE